MFEFDFEDARLYEKEQSAGEQPAAERPEEALECGAPAGSSEPAVAQLLEAVLQKCDAGEVPSVRWRRRMWDCVAVLGVLDLFRAVCAGASRADVFYLPEEKTTQKAEVWGNLHTMWSLPEGASFLVVSFHWLRHLHHFLTRDSKDKVWAITLLNGAAAGMRHPLHSFMLVLDGQAGRARMVNCWRGVYTFAQWEGAGPADYPDGDGATGGFCGSGQLDEELITARSRFGCGRWLATEALVDFFHRFEQLAVAMGRNDVHSMHKHSAYLFGVPMAALYSWPPVISASVVVSELCL